MSRRPVGAQVEHRQPGERLQVQHSFEPVVAHVEELERDERPQRPGGLEAAAAEVEAREGHGQSLERLEADGFVGEVLHGAPLVVRRGGPCVLAATCSLGHAAGCGSETRALWVGAGPESNRPTPPERRRRILAAGRIGDVSHSTLARLKGVWEKEFYKELPLINTS